MSGRVLWVIKSRNNFPDYREAKMKQHLFTLALSTGLVSPLMAQDPYYPAYGYATDPGYYQETNQPQLNFNPGNMMNLPVNPARN
ncbi:MAG: hypothetical protein P8166_14120, partial [Candidatus Thiodiazotropha sp.]